MTRRIAEVSVHAYVVPLRRPFVTAARAVDRLEGVLVRVRDDDGHEGWGEAALSWQVTGESESSVRAYCSEAARLLVGREAGDRHAAVGALRRGVRHNAAATSAVDSALLDLAARAHGASAEVLLGAIPRPLRTSATLSVGTPAAVARDAVAAVADGFTVLKLKVDGTVADETIALVQEVRAAVGTTAELWLDANQSWTPKHAIRTIHRLEDLDVGVTVVEQPVHRSDLDGLAHVTREVTTTVMADESVTDEASALDIVRRRAADVLNIKLAKCGGPTAAARLAAVAHAAGVGVLFGTMLEGPVGVATTAAVAAACAPAATHDLDAAWWLAQPLPIGPVPALRYEGGCVLVPGASGD